MIAIVVVGYNRKDSIIRLLNSICKANYGKDKVDLIISLDYSSEQQTIANSCNQIQWDYGEKIIVSYSENQGLRKHILSCGDYALKYDAVVILEDDLVVSPHYYHYIKKAIETYDTDSNIAGISLYSYHLNEFNSLPFIPLKKSSDVYAMQVAQSWGQCWTMRMWKAFKEWPEHDAAIISNTVEVPNNVYRWGATSWKKNYMKYIVEKNKFFIYPYFSLSTNYTEVGTHNKNTSTYYQVPLLMGDIKWCMRPFDECVKYDVFFESIDVKDELQNKYRKKVCMNLNGLKTNFQNTDLLVSLKKLPFEIVDSMSLELYPIELNCNFSIHGKDIKIYNARKPIKSIIKIPNKINHNLVQFYYPGLRWRNVIRFVIAEFFNSLCKKIQRVLLR